MQKTVIIIGIVLLAAQLRVSAQLDGPWTLEKCIGYALSQNIQVRKTELTNQRLELSAEQTRAQRLPSASASISQNFNWSKSTATGSSAFPKTSVSKAPATRCLREIHYLPAITSAPTFRRMTLSAGHSTSAYSLLSSPAVFFIISTRAFCRLALRQRFFIPEPSTPTATK